MIEDKNGSPTHSAVDWGHIALLLGDNYAEELERSSTTQAVVGRLQQSEIDKRGELKGPYRSFFLMMGRMKASTTDNAETHIQVCAESWPHSQQQQQQQQ